jgi:transporter family-2 protein
MNHFTLLSLAFIGGVFLAIQGGLNAQLGVLLKHPLWAALTAFSCSALFALLFLLLQTTKLPDLNALRSVPGYLWFAGGLFSVLGIGLYYYTIPRLGVSTMISLGLSGQLIFAVVAGHFGWFGMPVEPMDLKRIAGVITMIFGILLIHLK